MYCLERETMKRRLQVTMWVVCGIYWGVVEISATGKRCSRRIG